LKTTTGAQAVGPTRNFRLILDGVCDSALAAAERYAAADFAAPDAMPLHSTAAAWNTADVLI
jgi:hypothetical protein